MLAKIMMNGKEISQSGIVLRPGERVYLQRFLDSNSKFLFETYEVENKEESIDAIQINGLLEVSFYSELTSLTIGTTTGNYVYPSTLTIHNGSPYATVHTGSPYTGNCNFSVGGSISANLSDISFAGTTVNTSVCYTESLKEHIETGRIEKGVSSDQILESANGNFSSFISNSVSYKMLPESNKPVEISKLRNYCPECRTRIKKDTWKFCPSCGEKL
jgi:hypothetical protein